MQNNKKTIGVVGPGYVGQGIIRLFGDQVQAVYSPSGNSVPQEFKQTTPFENDGTPERKARDTKEAINNCDLIVLAVGCSGTTVRVNTIANVWRRCRRGRS